MDNIIIQFINKNTFMKRRIVSTIGVDLQNCHPEIFNGKIYNKKLYGDDLFLFFNSRCELVGATIGATYQKDFEGISAYNYDLKKNRKGLEESSHVILRIPANERIYYERFNKKYDSKFYQLSLYERLRKYKNSKNKMTNQKQIENMLRELLILFSTNFFNKDFDVNRFEKHTNYYSLNMEGLMRSAIELSESYKNYIRIFRDEERYYKKNYPDWTIENSKRYEQYLTLITKITDFYKCLEK